MPGTPLAKARHSRFDVKLRGGVCEVGGEEGVGGDGGAEGTDQRGIKEKSGELLEFVALMCT